MAFCEFLNHTCDIYHIKKTDSSPGYNLPPSPAFSYGDKPDIQAQACHFGTKSASMIINQKEPQSIYEAKIKLALPIGIDVRLNDKIVHCETGYEYTADIPIDVQGHHLFVYLQRKSQQEAL